MAIFEQENYQLISKFVETKIPLLRENNRFNEKYLRIAEIVEELEKNLSEEKQKLFHEMIKLNYEIEEYYFALSYSLGIKYGEDLNKL